MPWDRSHDLIEALRSEPRYARLATRDAVALFQKRNDLPITGELDARTEAALVARRASTSSHAEQLQRLQRGLRNATARLDRLEHTLDIVLVDALDAPIATSALLVRLPGDEAGQWVTFGSRTDLFVLKKLAQHGLAQYEPGTIATILALLDEHPGPFLDVGANVGVFSLLVAAMQPGRPVVAFEPTPDLATELRDLATANDVAIDVAEVALGRTDGEVTLYISPTDTSNSLREGFRDAVDEVTVPGLRLDSWVAGNLETAPTVIKIDTESTEPDVLNGAHDLVATHRPWLVVEVLKGRTEDELQAFCDRHDYRAHHIREHGPVAPSRIVGDDTYEHLNWLFAPADLPADFDARRAAWQRRIDTSLTLDRR